MALAIILRKQLSINRFRDLMIDAINTGQGNNALLCSGFFQEDYHGYGYRATQERNFAKILASKRISLITVGIYHAYWKQSYVKFKNNLLAAGVNISAKYKNGLKWHAKVFILSRDQDPIFGIVGSSNITRRAFGSSIDFNYECDAVIWPDSEQEINKVANEFLDVIDDYHEVIRAPYEIDRNWGLTVQDRLNEIKREILEIGLTNLD